jgi:YegS/Rv2252/BmrU family lipid kinase
MRVLLIHNPTAGQSRRHRDLPDAVAVLTAGGWRVEWAATAGPGEAEHLAQQAAVAGYDAVLVAGGDGTIHQVVNGLMAARQARLSPVMLAILPAGTANVLAHEIDLAPAPGMPAPHSLVAAARQLLRASLAWIDLGRMVSANSQRYFACWAGIGLDAAVSAAVESQPPWKQRIKPALFAVNTLLELGRPEAVTRFTMTVDDTVWRAEGMLAVVSNIRRYALVLKMAPQAFLNDGLLDCVLFRGNVVEAALPLAKVLTGAHVEDTDVYYQQARRIVVETTQPRPVHMDAEPAGFTPIIVEVAPQALPLLLPASAAARHLVPGAARSHHA